jgi:signal transduction histidine kinase
MLEAVHHDAGRVTRLVSELLDISRLETGGLVLRRRLVDLPALCDAVVERLTFTYPDLDCTLDFDEPFPTVPADADKVEQVFTNLIENAAKYADPTGVRIVGRVEDDHVTVEVEDRGAGIRSEDLPRVFTKFFRGDHGSPSGTGLGLWISRGLAEAHGGSLDVASRPGEGSGFVLSLPLDAAESTGPPCGA